MLEIARKFWNAYNEDLLTLAGFACVVYGMALLNSAAAWITAGVLLCVLGWMTGKAKAQNVSD